MAPDLCYGCGRAHFRTVGPKAKNPGLQISCAEFAKIANAPADISDRQPYLDAAKARFGNNKAKTPLPLANGNTVAVPPAPPTVPPAPPAPPTDFAPANQALDTGSANFFTVGSDVPSLPDRSGGQYQVRYDKRKGSCGEGNEKRKQRKSNWDVRPEAPNDLRRH